MDDSDRNLLDSIDLNPDEEDQQQLDISSPGVVTGTSNTPEPSDIADPFESFLTSTGADVAITSTVPMTHGNGESVAQPPAQATATYSRPNRQSSHNQSQKTAATKTNGNSNTSRKSKPGSRGNNNSTPSRLRSLICDANGIIIAEMVFRCMVCAKIHETSGEAQCHYSEEHMDENENNNKSANEGKELVPVNNHDIDIDLKSNGSLNSSLRNSPLVDDDMSQSDLPPMTMQLLEEEEGEDSDLDGDILSTPAVTISVPNNLRQLQQQNIYQKHQQQQLHYQSLPPPSNYSNSTKLHNKSIVHSSSSSPSNTILMPISITSSSTTEKPPPQKKMGGYVTCEVCNLTKYYSHISRRYGVFSCESCAKFFYRYLLKPTQFTCPNNGNCSLQVEVPGGRCKSCLLTACLQKYVIDPKRHPKIFEKTQAVEDVRINVMTTNNMTRTVTSTPKTQVIHVNNKDSIPKLPKEIAATPITKSGPVKPQFHQIDDVNSFLESNSGMMVKSSSNGILIKAINAPQSIKRKRDSQDSQEISISIKGRRGGCRECAGCLADDCGQCLYCLDKPKFGGSDIKKQRCIKRRCLKAN